MRILILFVCVTIICANVSWGKNLFAEENSFNNNSTKTYKKWIAIKKSTNFSEATELVTKELIAPEDNQVLVKNIYVGINGADIIVLSGPEAVVYPHDKYPFDIGFESVGVIEAIGKNVTNGLKVGQNVFYYHSNGGAFSQYIYVKPDVLSVIPEAKPEYVGLGDSGFTALIALKEKGRLNPNEKVFITASAGGLGHIAVQLAKLNGSHVVGQTSEPEKAKVLKDLGIDRVINYKTENLNDVLTKEYPSGFDVIVDTVGTQSFDILFNHLAKKGRYVLVKGDPKPWNITNISIKLAVNNQSINGVFIDAYNDVKTRTEYFKYLIDLIENKKLKVLTDLGEKSSEGKFDGIEDIVRAEEYLAKGKNIGKVIVKIQDP